MNLEALLHECGLNQTQQSVLGYLLVHGNRSAASLSKAINIKRPTVYAALGELENQGLVTSFKLGGRTIFSSVSPKVLPRVLEAQARERFEQIRRSTVNLEQAIEDAQLQRSDDVVQYSVKHYDVATTAFLEHFRFSMVGGFRAIFNPNLALNKNTRSAVRAFLKESGERQYHFQELAVPGEGTNEYLKYIDNPNHEVRLLPSDMEVRSNIIIRDENVSITHYHREELSTIQIHQPDFSTSMEALFSLLWEQGETVK